MPLGQQQIGQPKQTEHLRSVFRQATVASLAMMKAVFHHVKRVLDLGANLGLQELQLIEQLSFWSCGGLQRIVPRWVAGDE